MDRFEDSLPMILHRTLDAVIPKYRKIFKEHDVSEQQWRILRVLWELENCTSAELAKRTLLPSPSMVGVIDRMMAKELVERKRSSKDRRIVFVSLTEKGKKLEHELVPKIDQVYEKIVGSCDPQAWRSMIATLQLVIDANTVPSEQKSKNVKHQTLDKEALI